MLTNLLKLNFEDILKKRIRKIRDLWDKIKKVGPSVLALSLKLVL